jgi:hypothetical protein
MSFPSYEKTPQQDFESTAQPALSKQSHDQ